MDYGIWGIGTAIAGAVCYVIGLVHGYILGRLYKAIRKRKPRSARHMEPVTRPMQAVERPVEEQPTQVVPALDIWADLAEMKRKGQI